MTYSEVSLFEIENKELKIKKHSSLIQMYNITTAQQRKAMDALIWIAKETLKVYEDTHSFNVNLGTVKKLAGIKSHNNELLKESLKKLNEIQIEYNTLNKDKKTTR